MVKKGTTRRRQGGSINAEPTVMVWAYVTVRSYTLCSMEELNKGCTDPRGEVTMMTEFCTVTPSIWGSSAWNLHHGTLLAPTSYRWLLHFWKIFSTQEFNNRDMLPCVKSLSISGFISSWMWRHITVYPDNFGIYVYYWEWLLATAIRYKFKLPTYI